MRTCCSCKYFVLWTTLSIRPLNDNKPDVNLTSLLYYNCIVLWTSVLWFELLWQDILSTLHCFMDPPIPWLRAPSSFSHPLELDCSFLLSADFYLSVGQGAIEHFCCKGEPCSFSHPLEQGYSFLLSTDFLFVEALIKLINLTS